MIRRLCVTPTIVDALVRHSEAARPDECCGLLAGRFEPDGAAVALDVFPVENEAKSPTEFLATIGLLKPFKEMRARGEELVAIYHSHPAAPARPSRTDLERNYYGDTIQVIVSLATRPATLKAFVLGADSFAEVPLEVAEHATSASGG